MKGFAKINLPDDFKIGECTMCQFLGRWNWCTLRNTRIRKVFGNKKCPIKIIENKGDDNDNND